VHSSVQLSSLVDLVDERSMNGEVFVSDLIADYFHIPRIDLRKHFNLQLDDDKL
jgi:hypothetical protein